MATTYAIPDGRLAMAATTYTGTGATQVVSNAVNGVAMQPDLVWLKSRSVARNHRLMDTVRGINNVISSDLTTAEYAGSALSSINSNGFTLNTTDNQNVSAETYIGWQWKAGGTAVSNTAGSITSSVSANTTAGFSVVTYTGTGANATVGHGLGVAPKMVIIKQRNGTGSWVVWQTSYSPSYRLDMETTNALFGPYSTFMQDTVPSSSVVYLGTNGNYNASGSTYVAYCFAPVAGYSAFGSYTGNGSTDGPFIYTGMRTRWLLIKETGNANSWELFDTSRDPYNISSQRLFPNDSAAEATTASLDILSNGFKFRVGNTGINRSGGTYIYMAFAENPFKYANAR